MVRTDPGKVWKSMENIWEIFKALKSLENDRRYALKSVEKDIILSWKTTVRLLYEPCNWKLEYRCM